MTVVFSDLGWEDYTSWVGEKKVLVRINRLIGEARRDPAVGIGKPEPLRGDLAGFWSRRIDDEHRLIYSWTVDRLTIIQARHHY